MSMEDLFGSDLESEEEDGGNKSTNSEEFDITEPTPVSRLNRSGDDESDDDETQIETNSRFDTLDDDHKQEGKNIHPNNEGGVLSAPTQQDIFGEDVDVSSDEDNAQPFSSQGDDGIDHENEAAKGSDEEEEEEAVPIEIGLPKCNMSLGKELYFLKLPNFLSIETKPFDVNYYEDEIDDDEIMDEEGRARLKLKVENTIRWRLTKGPNGNDMRESNSKIVRWSDGSLSLHLGNEIFDTFKMPIQGDQNQLFVQQGTGLQAQTVFKEKLTFRPHSTASHTHRKMTMSIADRMAKAQRIKMMPAAEHDPESHRQDMLKKEEERMKAQTRREGQQRRMREKSHSKGLSASFLEGDAYEDEEQELEESLAAIKNRYKKDVKGDGAYAAVRDVYSDDSDEADEKLLNAKNVLSSDDENTNGKVDDDDDLDPTTKKRRSLSDPNQKKKKISRKIIEDSDEESD